MLSSTLTKDKPENLEVPPEKGENLPENVEVYKSLLNAQKKFIEQQKLLIDWLSGQVVSSDSNASPHKPFKQLLKERPTQLWIAASLLALISISSVIVYFSVSTSLYHTPTPVPPSNGHTDDLGDGIQVIHRKEWLARDPLYVHKYSKSPKMVRILHTAGEFCGDYQICANKVLGLQGIHVGDKGMPDIGYNYLIGGDGGVYMGRGADVESGFRPEALDIAYIGNYLAPYDQMSAKMEESGRKLIERLRERGKLSEDYVVVAQNQTEKSTGPGENIFKKIIYWPHYDSRLYYKDQD